MFNIRYDHSFLGENLLCIQFGAWMQNFPEVSTLPGAPLRPLTGMLLTLLHQHCQTEEKETPGPGYGPLLLLTCILLIEDDKSQALRSPAADTASKESSGKAKQDGCGRVTSRGHKEWQAGKWCCCSCLSEMPWKGQDPANAPKPSLQGAPHGAPLRVCGWMHPFGVLAAPVQSLQN